MKNKTLKGYYISLLCMVLTCAMFMGTTFAWFTDDVVSSGNELMIGTLKAELYHHQNGTQVPVTTDHPVFDPNTLWAPNHTQVQTLTVKNAGDLAFDYYLQFLPNASGCVFTGGMTLPQVAKWFEVYTCTEDPANLPAELTDSRWVKVKDANGADADLAKILAGSLHVWEGSLEKEKTGTLSIALHLSEQAPVELMGQKLSLNVKLVANQLGYVDCEYAANAQELTDGLAKGGNVKMTENITAPAATTAPYGNKYGFALNGGTLDGNGKTLSVTGDGDTYGIMTNGGTIKNLTIDSGFRAIMLMYAQEDLILENVKLAGDGVGYPINTGEHGKAVKLVASNSYFAGWSSFAGISDASFTACTFGQGTYWGGIDNDRVIKPYVNTVFADCDFVQGTYFDLSALGEGCKVTLSNCTVNGTVLTADNWQSLLDAIELPGGKTIADCVVFG